LLFIIDNFYSCLAVITPQNHGSAAREDRCFTPAWDLYPGKTANRQKEQSMTVNEAQTHIQVLDTGISPMNPGGRTDQSLDNNLRAQHRAKLT